MKETGKPKPVSAGKYLPAPLPQTGSGRKRSAKFRRCLTVLVLLCWDGLLLYMILRCLIQPACGGLFIAIVSINLGYLLKEE